MTTGYDVIHSSPEIIYQINISHTFYCFVNEKTNSKKIATLCRLYIHSQ